MPNSIEGPPIDYSPNEPALGPAGDQLGVVELDSNPSELASIFFADWQEADYPPVTKGRSEIENQEAAWVFMDLFYFKLWYFAQEEEELAHRARMEKDRLVAIYPNLELEVVKDIWETRVKPHIKRSIPTFPKWWGYVSDEFREMVGKLIVPTDQLIDELLADGSPKATAEAGSLVRLILWMRSW